MAVTIDITDRVTPLLQSARATLRPGAMEAVMGQAVKNRIQSHLFELDSTRANKLGGDRTHFYSQAAKGTHADSKPGEFTVTVSQIGFRQRLLGGEIRPVKSKFLTIPATADAYGHRASEFNNLRFAILGGKPALIEAQATRIKIGRQKKDGSRTVKGVSSSTGLKVYFWLARSVNQVADPSVLPTEGELIGSALDAATKVIQRAEEKG